ncbi:MAG: hypothetical protein PW735_12825 [Acidobacteriaceae bacterium]|nr:hypothetical protein [Acidobacteriaceae bacterium]
MKPYLIVSVAALAAASLGVSAYAQQAAPQGNPPADAPGMHHNMPGPGGPGAHGHRSERHEDFRDGFGRDDREWWKNPQIAAHLGLTPDQVQKLDALSLDGHIAVIRLEATLEENEVILRSMMDDPTVEEQKATAQIDKVADSRAAVEKVEARLALHLREVLTPDQWEKMHEAPADMPPPHAHSPKSGTAPKPPAPPAQ